MADQQPILEALSSLLECSVCFETFGDGQIRQCDNGHYFCTRCTQNLGQTCPVCRSETLTFSRNLFAEKVIELIPRKCRFADYGCEVKLKKNEVAKHEAQCYARFIGSQEKDILVEAMRAGQFEATVVLLSEIDKRGIDINYVSKKDGTTALFWACVKGFDWIDLLLKSPVAKKINFDYCFEFKMREPFVWSEEITAFIFSCWRGDVSVVKRILEDKDFAGVATRGEGSKGSTGFHLAILGRKALHVLDMLVEYKYYPIATRDIRSDPSIFDLACKKGDVKVLAYLLKLNQDQVNHDFIVNCSINNIEKVKIMLKTEQQILKNKDVEESLILACYSGHTEIVQTILKYGPQDLDINRASSKDGLSPLRAACVNNKPEVVKILLDSVKDVRNATEEKGIDCNVASRRSGHSAFHVACGRGNLATVQVLLKHKDKVNINQQDWDGNTGFHLACYHGNHEVTLKLLTTLKSTQVNIANGAGKTGFHLACELGHLDVVKTFWNLDFDFNKRDMHGRTGLHLACQNGHLKVVETLLDITNIDAQAKDNAGQSPFEIAYVLKHHKIVNLFYNRGIGPKMFCNFV